MTNFAIKPPPQPSLPITGSDARFPVRRVYCVGRNFADHAIEMGHDPTREHPFFFQKNPDNLISDGTFPYPPLSGDVHHEVELYIALSQGGSDIPVETASACIFGAGIAIDMTRRDLQSEAKKKGRPWTMGKAFENSAPAGPAHPGAPPDAGEIALSIDGDPRQSGDLNQMIWKPAEIIAELSRFVTLAAGDVILTGTPAGVGPIERGQTIRAENAGLEPHEKRVTKGVEFRP
ncbi:MAG: fumarylacetoacetate hydrolase family protein [Pseudomonadota bacterium]